jgi:hypothetical protein
MALTTLRALNAYRQLATIPKNTIMVGPFRIE